MEQLKKRLKSFGWRLGGVVVVSFLSFALEPDTLSAIREAGLTVPAVVVSVLSLVVNELTKYLNRGAK